MDRYSRICVENNSDFSIYYGVGNYCSAHESLLHYDMNYTISFFPYCCGNIKVIGNHYNLSNGDVVIMNPKEIHCCEIDENSYHERISICINKSFFHNYCLSCKELFDFFDNRPNGTGNIIPSKIVNDLNLNTLFHQILTLTREGGNKNKVLCIYKIVELLYHLSDTLPKKKALSIFCAEEIPIISAAIKYIDSHFSDDIDCSEVAKKVSVSKFYLDHMFRKFVGIPLWEYVIIKRLFLVNEHLQNGLSINEASYLAGFHNYSNFYRLYKKHFNMTPKEYKKSLKK